MSVLRLLPGRAVQYSDGGGREEGHRPGEILGGRVPAEGGAAQPQLGRGLRGLLHGLSLDPERDALRLFPGREQPADESRRADGRAGISQRDLSADPAHHDLRPVGHDQPPQAGAAGALLQQCHIFFSCRMPGDGA